MRAKSPSESYFVSRRLVMPDLINPNGILFGGVLMSWIDMTAYMSAQRHAERPHVVTVNIDNIEFHEPLRIGDHVILSSKVVLAGKTSMEIWVLVEKEEACSGRKTQSANALLTFVALDDAAKPTTVPTLIIERDQDQQNWRVAHIHRKVRGRISRWFEKNRVKMAITKEEKLLAQTA